MSTDKTLVEQFQENIERLELGRLAPETCFVLFSFPCQGCGQRCTALQRAGDTPAAVCDGCGARYEVLVQIAYQRIDGGE